MAQQKEYCKETNQTVTLYMNLWEDEYTGLESLKGIRCAYQQTCSFFDRQTLCPTLVRVRKSYSDGS